MSREFILLPLSYLLGSIPTGVLLSKACGVDIRAAGSGNIGATNVYRTLGRRIGIMTLIGDCLKGVLPVLAAKALGFDMTWVAAAGVAAFLGHVYTLFLGFKGGKGVATALGVFLAATPLAVLVAVAVFAFVLWKWRYVSLASISAAASMPLIIYFTVKPPPILAMAFFIAALVIYKHKDNIQRLLTGTENRFKA